MSLTYTTSPFNYENTRDRILKYAENRPLALAAETDPNAISFIHEVDTMVHESALWPLSHATIQRRYQ